MVKILKKIILILLVLFVLLAGYLFIGKSKPAEKVEWGISFSKKATNGLELDWKEVFLAILNDLKVKKFRLIAYWDEIEKQEGKYDFTDLDWQVSEIEKRGGEIILAVGRRLPAGQSVLSRTGLRNFQKKRNRKKF